MPTKTELIWDGKYDATGKRVAPLRVALPFQTVETVNETAQDRARNLFQPVEQDKPWRNRLIWGDKKYVLPSLLAKFAGKVNLITVRHGGGLLFYRQRARRRGRRRRCHCLHQATEPHRAEGV